VVGGGRLILLEGERYGSGVLGGLCMSGSEVMTCLLLGWELHCAVEVWSHDCYEALGVDSYTFDTVAHTY